MPAKLDQLILDRQRVAIRGPFAWPQVGSPHVLFTIVGGPVWIKALFAYANVATGAASSLLINCGAVPLQNATVVCNLLIGEIAIWPLQTGAGFIIIPNVGAAGTLSAMPTSAALTSATGNAGIVAAPGTAGGDVIALTVAAADMVGAMSFYCVYYGLHPASRII